MQQVFRRHGAVEVTVRVNAPGGRPPEDGDSGRGAPQGSPGRSSIRCAIPQARVLASSAHRAADGRARLLSSVDAAIAAAEDLGALLGAMKLQALKASAPSLGADRRRALQAEFAQLATRVVARAEAARLRVLDRVIGDQAGGGLRVSRGDSLASASQALLALKNVHASLAWAARQREALSDVAARLATARAPGNGGPAPQPFEADIASDLTPEAALRCAARTSELLRGLTRGIAGSDTGTLAVVVASEAAPCSAACGRRGPTPPPA